MRLDHLLSKENRISEQLIQQSYGRYCESSKDENKSDTLSLLRLYVSNEDCQLNNAKNRVKCYLIEKETGNLVEILGYTISKKGITLNSYNSKESSRKNKT